MCFPKRLKELRLAHGETQKDLANAIEVGRTTISEYESGKIVPKQEGLLRIANHFNVSVDYLTGVSNERATRKQNTSNLDALLNTILRLHTKVKYYQKHKNYLSTNILSS